MMAGKIGTFSFRPAIEMIGFGGHRETATSVLTSPTTAAGNSPRPVARGKDGNFPLLSLNNSEENLTPIQEEEARRRCEEEEEEDGPNKEEEEEEEGRYPPSLFSPQPDIYGTASPGYS